MKNLLFLTGFLLLLSSCEQKESPPANEGLAPVSDTLTFLERHILRTYGECADPEHYKCTRAEMDYVLVTSGVEETVRKRINKTILTNLMHQAPSPEAYLDSFLLGYQEYVESDFEFMDEEPGWIYEGALSPALNDSRVLTLEFLEMLFTGGAHGSYQTKYWHFNCYTGTSLNLRDLISEDKMQALQEIGEHHFRKAMHLRNDGSINKESGFAFPGDEFYLPEVYALLPNGLTFTFGTYEIASYADGEISFFIPYQELSALSVPGSVLASLAKKPPRSIPKGS